MQIRFINADEAEACNDFHNRIFGENRSIDQWRWGFISNSFTSGRIPFVVVDDDGKIVGTQAFIPIRMIDDNGVFWTVKSEETLVDPQYRGKRLFEKMYALLIDYLNEQDLHCIWGFTAATKAFLRLGFKSPGVTSQLFMPFSGKAVARAMEGQTVAKKAGFAENLKGICYTCGSSLAGIYSSLKFARAGKHTGKSSGTTGIEIMNVEQPPDDAGELTERFVKRWGGTTIYRDAEYLSWRLFDNPYLRSIFRAAYVGDQLVGWIAYTIGDDSIGYIVDLIAAADDKPTAKLATELLLRNAVISLRDMGALGVRGWRVNNHPFDMMAAEVAKGLGFYHAKRGYSAVILINENSDRKSFLDRFDNWFINRIFTEGVSG